MCIGRHLLDTLYFGPVIFCAQILTLLTTECRFHLSFDGKACAKIVGKSLLCTIPVAATIMVVQSVLRETDEAMVCLDRSAFVAGAFILSALLTFVSVSFAQVKEASGVNPSEKYLGRLLLLLFASAIIFHTIRQAIGVWWQ